MIKFKKYFLVMFVLNLFTILFAQDKPLVAVLDLKGVGISNEELHILTNRLRTQLFLTSKFNIVERQRMKDILDEQGFQLSGCSDTDCAVEVGKLLNTEYVILGNVDRINDIFTISLRQVNIESGLIENIVNDDCIKCTIDDVLLYSITNLAFRMADKKTDIIKSVDKGQQVNYSNTWLIGMGSLLIGEIQYDNRGFPAVFDFIRTTYFINKNIALNFHYLFSFLRDNGNVSKQSNTVTIGGMYYFWNWLYFELGANYTGTWLHDQDNFDPSKDYEEIWIQGFSYLIEIGLDLRIYKQFYLNSSYRITKYGYGLGVGLSIGL